MKTKFFVETSDLHGYLLDMPVQVVTKMLERMYDENNYVDIDLMRHNVTSCAVFNWEVSLEGDDFWNEVINERNYDVFFERYPDRSYPVYIDASKIKKQSTILAILKRYGAIEFCDVLLDDGWQDNFNDALYIINQDGMIDCYENIGTTSDFITSVFMDVTTEAINYEKITANSVSNKAVKDNKDVCQPTVDDIFDMVSDMFGDMFGCPKDELEQMKHMFNDLIYGWKKHKDDTSK